MKRDYSFNEISRITMGAPDNENKPPSQPYFTSSKQPRDSWTDMRVEQIKKKYDTPSHRKNYSNYSNNNVLRETQGQSQGNVPYASYRNNLKDSNAGVSSMKKDKPNIQVNYIQNTNQDSQSQSHSKNSWQQNQYVPRFSYDSKENSNFMQKFSQAKNSYKYESKSTSNNKQPTTQPQLKLKQYPATKIDPRVQNIDKINMKIKKILDCLNQNQKFTKQQPKQQLAGSFMKRSIVSKDNHSQQLEQTKIISRQKVSYQKQTYTKMNVNSSMMLQNNKQYCQSPQTRQDQSKWRLQDKYKYMKNTQSFLNDSGHRKKIQDQTDSWFEPAKKLQDKSRSRSCLENFKNQDIKLNSGKKLDDEITKINARIKQFQQEKKKLNIQFKPYKYEMKYNRSTSNLADHKTQRSSFKPPLPKNANKSTQFNPFSNVKVEKTQKMKTQSSEYYQPRYTLEPKKSVVQDSKPLGRMNSKYFNVEQRNQRNQQSIRTDANRQKSFTPQFQERHMQNLAVQYESTTYNDNEYQSQAQEKKTQKNQCSQEFKQKTQQGIQQRKRKLLETATVTFDRQTKRLISNLFEQVKLDQDLRNAKIWFRDEVNTNKWDILRQQAMKAGIQCQMYKFEVTQEQDNPFYSVRQSQQSYSCLVSRWIKAEKYWKQNIANQFNLREFQVQKFTNDKVDLDKKGYFVVQDLVRFLNMETGTFYRNRDLILVFRRLTQSDKLHWPQFLANLDQSKTY